MKAEVNETNYAWVAVNPDGEFRIFTGKPFRTKEAVKVEDLSCTLEDHYGKEYHPLIHNGEYREYWNDYSYHGVYDSYDTRHGAVVNPDALPTWIRDMTWESDAVPLTSQQQ